MIKSSWFYVKFKHAEKVSTAPAAALPRALLGLSCSPSPGNVPGSVTGNRLSWGSTDKEQGCRCGSNFSTVQVEEKS